MVLTIYRRFSESTNFCSKERWLRPVAMMLGHVKIVNLCYFIATRGNGGPTSFWPVGQRWPNSGMPLLGHRWANVILASGPTLAQQSSGRRWADIGTCLYFRRQMFNFVSIILQQFHNFSLI